MRIATTRLLCTATLFLSSAPLIAADRPTAVKPAKTEPAPTAKTSAANDEKTIRDSAEQFAKAFNSGDAKAIAAHWAEQSLYTDESGQEFHGRAAIEKEYASQFKEHPGATIAVTVDSIQFLGPDIAIEKGIATVKPAKGEGGSSARYTVTHVRQGGAWSIVVGRDMPYVAVKDGDYLHDLAWLIGDWKAEGKAGLQLEAKSEWLAGRNFIKNTYTVIQDGKPTVSGAQIIGWNPRLGKIVGWHFDAQGGFGNDVWTKDGGKWVVDAGGLFRDGSESTAVNIVTPIDANSFTFESTKRTLDHIGLPNLGPVKLTRVAVSK